MKNAILIPLIAIITMASCKKEDAPKKSQIPTKTTIEGVLKVEINGNQWQSDKTQTKAIYTQGASKETSNLTIQASTTDSSGLAQALQISIYGFDNIGTYQLPSNYHDVVNLNNASYVSGSNSYSTRSSNVNLTYTSVSISEYTEDYVSGTFQTVMYSDSDYIILNNGTFEKVNVM